MLFNSYVFIFLYLPVVLLGFYQVARISHRWAAVWLAAASLFFYGYWSLSYIWLLLASVTFNYVFGNFIVQAKSQASKRKLLLVIALSANIGLLAYYKYANFFLGNLNHMAGTHFLLTEIILPLGISFFTFTQIAFLVDAYYGKVDDRNFIHYLLFVTYFPHLIAGPILHHRQMMSQFTYAHVYSFRAEKITLGLAVFAMGLFKKVYIADGFSTVADPFFDASNHGFQLDMLDAWSGALAYTLQLYFDFSGYSDMAIGLSLLFGINIPQNFNSPYKAASIIEFWHRWHMTLSQFLRDYLYFPLGGSRHGQLRKYLNLLITMLLGGLWHGANWTFFIWGALHGIYLVTNHAWRQLRATFAKQAYSVSLPERVFGIILTFFAVVFAWVIFRSASMAASLHYLSNMFFGRLDEISNIQISNMLFIVVMLIFIFFAPNTNQIHAFIESRLSDKRVLAVSVFLTGCLLSVCLLQMYKAKSVFIYWQF